jgi:hypothetical protein
VRKNNFDEIEFRHSRFGGHAKGRFAILIFAGLVTLSVMAMTFICWRITSVGIAYYDHLDGPQSRAMTNQSTPSSTLPLREGRNLRQRIPGRGMS